MSLTRRRLLQGAFIAAAAAGTGRAALARHASTAPVGLRVYDSRLPLSRAWAGDVAGDAIDVAHEQASRWVRLRGAAPDGRVAGLTTWSDYVQARGVLLEKGRRLRVESRSGQLFYWEMV